MRAPALVVASALLALLFAPVAGAWTWPVGGPLLRPFVFGGDPYLGGQHRGIDLGGAPGASVAAPASGLVSFVGTVPGGGAAVTIRTADGYSATLVHLGSVGALRGSVVEEGAPVGTLGPSGDAEWPEPYLHFGVRVTAEPQGYVDPLSLLPPRQAPAAAPADDDAPPAAAPAGGTGADESDGAADGESETPSSTPESENASAEAGSNASGSAEDAGQTAGAEGDAASGADAAEAGDAGTAGDASADAESPQGEAASSDESAADATDQASSAEATPTADGESAPAGDDAEAVTEPAAEEPTGSEQGAGSGDAPADATAGTDARGGEEGHASLPSDDPPVVDEELPDAGSATHAPDTSAPAAETPVAPVQEVVPAEPEAAVPDTPAVEDGGTAAEASPAPPAVEPLGRVPRLDVGSLHPFERMAVSSGEVLGAAGSTVRLMRTRAHGGVATQRFGPAMGGKAPGPRAARQPASTPSVAARATRVRVEEARRALGHAVPSNDRFRAGDVPEARRLVGTSDARPSSSSIRLPGALVLAALLVALASAVALVLLRRRTRREPRTEPSQDARIISILGARAAEDPGRGRVAVCERAEAHRSRRGVRRAVGHLRAVPPAEGQRRPHGQRDGRARHTGDGRGGQGRRLAA
jgi:Peptidase family M23